MPHLGQAKRAWTGGIYDEKRRAWLNDLKGKTEASQAFKQNEWNKFRIECRGDSIKTWINGVAAADLKDGMTPKGFIALQVHATKHAEPLQVRWRNVYILPSRHSFLSRCKTQCQSVGTSDSVDTA